jgi:hypothetical protein
MHQQIKTKQNARRPNGYTADELTDLLDLSAPTVRPERQPPRHFPVADVPAPATQADDLPALKSRNDIFKRYRAYEASIDVACNAQWAAETDLFGFTMTERVSTQGICDIAKKAISTMIHNAQQKFSNQYTRLAIQVGDVLSATGQEGWREAYEKTPERQSRGKKAVTPRVRPEVPVDLDKIWDYLESTYGGDAGQTALYRQISPMLIRCLHLNGEDMRRTSTAVIAFQKVYSSPASFGSKTGPYTVGSSGDVTAVFDALAHVFEWAGLDDLAIALRPCCHKIGQYGFKYESREKATFPGLEVVMFKDTFDYKFSHRVAEKLQMFLGTFGI